MTQTNSEVKFETGDMSYELGEDRIVLKMTDWRDGAVAVVPLNGAIWDALVSGEAPSSVLFDLFRDAFKELRGGSDTPLLDRNVPGVD